MSRSLVILLAAALILTLGLSAPMLRSVNRSSAQSLDASPVNQEKIDSLTRPSVQTNQTAKLYPVMMNGKTGFIDNTGRLVIPAKFDPNLFWFGRSDGKEGVFSDGMALIKLYLGNSPKTSYPEYRHGFIDTTGKVVIPPQYEEAEDFSEGLAMVKVSTWREGYRTTKDRYGYIDKTGRMVLPAKYYAAGSFSEGLADFCEEGVGCGYMNRTGRIVFMLPEGLTAPSPFRDGLATVFVMSTGNYGFINHEGRLVYEASFGSYPMFSKGTVFTFPDGKRGLMDTNGHMAIQITNPKVYHYEEGMASIEEGGKLGYTDLSGRVVIQPQFSNADGFSEGLAAVEVKGQWGYIDKTGRMVIQPRFDLAGKFDGGIASVMVGWIKADVSQTRLRNGYIDKTGKYVWRPR